MLAGTDFLGIVVTNSSFQTTGHTLVLVISLQMLHNGTARKSPNFEKRAGKISPLTIDFGFLNTLIRPAT